MFVFTFSTVCAMGRREKNTIGPVRAGTPALTGLMELARQLRKGLLELASQLREASWSWQASSQDHRCLYLAKTMRVIVFASLFDMVWSCFHNLLAHYLSMFMFPGPKKGAVL